MVESMVDWPMDVGQSTAAKEEGHPDLILTVFFDRCYSTPSRSRGRRRGLVIW